MTSSKIDPKATPYAGLDDELEHAMKTLRKTRKPREAAMAKSSSNEPQPGGPGPRTSKAKTRAKTKVVKQGKPKGLQDDASEEKFDLKCQMTQREIDFIELFLLGTHTIENAMKLAGYKGYHKKSLYRLSRKVVAKYESLAGEHRKTFRAVGAGEVAVAQGLLKLATTAKSEMVKLNSWIAIGKILGLTQDVTMPNLGIQIIIKGRGDDSGRPAAQVRQEAPKVPPRTMAITK